MYTVRFVKIFMDRGPGPIFMGRGCCPNEVRAGLKAAGTRETPNP